MLEHFSIFSKGGVVLFVRKNAPIKGNPINSLVQKALIQERSGDISFSQDEYELNWTFANDLDLVFVVLLFCRNNI